MDAVLLFMDALLLFIDALMRVLGVVYGCVRCCIFHHGQCTFILFVDLAMHSCPACPMLSPVLISRALRVGASAREAARGIAR
eukprot:1169552-Rhodomonas_salina.3